MDERDTDRLPFGRRRRTAASALIAIVVALVLGAFFNAPAMKKTAEGMPFGGARSFKLALVDPLATVSHWLLLDRPHEGGQEFLDVTEKRMSFTPRLLFKHCSKIH